MARYAFTDKSRRYYIYAKDATTKDKAQFYICPNRLCNAVMYLCSVDGTSMAHFKALKRHPHIKNCFAGRKNSFNPAHYDEKSFCFNHALSRILSPSVFREANSSSKVHKTGESQKKPLRTIRQIYDMCKSHSRTDT